MSIVDITVIALLLLLVAMLGVVYHKLSSVMDVARLEAKRNANNIITQIEGLMALYAEVRSDRALPKSRGWAASPDVLGLMIRLAQEHKPTTVVECSSGFRAMLIKSFPGTPRALTFA